MKEKIEKLYTDALYNDVAPNVFAEQVLDLFIVSKTVFIVCENDDYGRDLYLDTKNTREEAEELKGRITSRNIYEHETE
tara:strand:- start:684 stop:920 length:237 start_codon:yes stop_codon:yes gene_type:complete